MPKRARLVIARHGAVSPQRLEAAFISEQERGMFLKRLADYVAGMRPNCTSVAAGRGGPCGSIIHYLRELVMVEAFIITSAMTSRHNRLHKASAAL
jgi:hypothetical protein